MSKITETFRFTFEFINFLDKSNMHTFNDAKDAKEEEGRENAIQCKRSERLCHRRNGW
jgi:hypothetical protein